MTQTITFKNGTTLPVIAVYSSKDLIQGAYRECFEIRFPVEGVTYEGLSEQASPENLSEITLTEKINEITNQASQYFNFTIITGIGKRTDSVDGSQFYFLSVAQKSDAELALEQLRREVEELRNR